MLIRTPIPPPTTLPAPTPSWSKLLESDPPPQFLSPISKLWESLDCGSAVRP